MIPPSAHKWKKDKELEGLLYFAQRMCELLYDKTLDTYKVPALNTRSVFFELYGLSLKYLHGVISFRALEFSLLEAESRIRAEIVFSDEDKSRFISYVKRMRTDSNIPKTMNLNVSVLNAEIGSLYTNKLKSKLFDLVRQPNKKKEIDLLTASFATELQNIGFHRGYIFAKTRKFFFSNKVGPKKITHCNVIDNFFKIFETDKKNFDVVFKGNDIPQAIQSLGNKFGIEIGPADIDIYKEKRNFDYFVRDCGDLDTYYVIKSIEEKDPHMARESASAQLDFFVDVCRFHNHKAEFYFSSVAYVYSIDEDKGYIIPQPLKPMECGLIYRVVEEERYMETSLDILSNKFFSRQERMKFIKIFDYHHAAMQSSSYDNQLVVLWASLEGFLPDPGKDTSRIEYYVKSLLPVLTMTYNLKIFENLLEDLKEAGEYIIDHIGAIDYDKDLLENTIKIITTDDYKDHRSELYSLLDCHPLLRHRCYAIHNIYSSTKSIVKHINKHREKLSLHIKRIYSTRNQIMHEAASFPYLRTLVENLHDYIDTMVLLVGKVGKFYNASLSIEAAIQIIKNRENEYIDKLSSGDVRLTRDNCLDLVIGPRQILMI